MRRDPERLRDTAFEVLVVGGGMHGAWIARRTAEAGYRVALIERGDFAAVTSANSLNILHGGLRYLQHLDLARMRSSIRARREFSRQSPQLVRALPCVMPLGFGGVRSPWILGPALLLNDAFSADRNAGVIGQSRLPNGRLMTARQCRQQVAALADLDPVAGALWWDALSLDSARLCLETVQAAASAGAVVANHIEAQGFLVAKGLVHGVAAVDHVSGEAFEIDASVVVDATGPGAGQLAVASKLAAPYLPQSWIGAINLVFRSSIDLQAAVALSSASKTADESALLRRATRDLFYVPWHGAVAVGTDYVALGSVDEGRAGPPATAVLDFIDEIGRVAPRSGLQRADLAAVHWGILPGVGGAEPTPRKTPIVASGRDEAGAENLVVVIGEKLTSAPTVSQVVLGRIAAIARPQSTQRAYPSPAARAARDDEHDKAGFEAAPTAALRLEQRYGAGWRHLFGPYGSQEALFHPVLTGAAVLAVEVVHAVREEMAMSLEDLLQRRLALAQAGRPAVELVKSVARIAGHEFGWPAEKQADEIAKFEAKTARSGPGPGPVNL